MTPTIHGVVALVVCLLYLSAATFAKPLTQSVELNSSDRLYYFGQTEVQDFELVSPQITRRGKHIEAERHAAFEAFGEVFNFTMKPAEGLFDAGTLVHEVGEDGKTVLSQPAESCLYVGTSVEHKDSAVSASDCGNKFEASVVTNEASFQVMPLKAEHQEKDGRTHMVIRRVIITDACDMNAERPLISAQIRGKRSTTDPIYVEASVVADDLMYKTYGNDTSNYLLTIINQVAGLLKDSSLDVQVNLKISNIKIIKSSQPDLSLSEELDKSLESFCSWQKESKSDISILITRRNLISAGSHQVTGKTADVAGACDPEKRCLIAQDHGPSGLIFTLAHEIGHSLGMYHDGGLSDCANKKNIMATVNSGGPEAFRWSECSNSDLLNFLDLPESKCLKDKPKSLPSYTPSSIPMPGFYYNATEQCAMSFNSKSTVASEVLNKPEICKALVCKTGKGAPESTNTPPLDGTRCGTKRDICIHGNCLKVYSTLDCNGGECIPFWLTSNFNCVSETCVETRSVLCVEQHDDGTTRRVTDLSRCTSDQPQDTRICMDDPCRYVFQTLEFGTCSVTCGSGVQTRIVYCLDIASAEAVDDTLCAQTAKPQTTQECNTGTTCPVTAYTFVTEAFGGCSVTCGIGLQTRTVSCRDVMGSEVIDAFCTTNNLVKPATTQQCSAGDCPTASGLRYIAGPLSACSVSCGTGIRTRMIYCVNAAHRVVDNAVCEDANLQPLPTEITCEQEACPVESYIVVRGQYGACSVNCGTGVETRMVLCLDQNGQQVAMQNCIDFGLGDLDTERVCTLSACPPAFSFMAEAYSDCSVRCGSGIRTRTIQCIDQQDQVVNIVNCLSLGLALPASSIDCMLEDCVAYIYQYGSFGTCSEGCGDGLQFRTVFCVNNGSNEIVNDANCPGDRPPSTQPCNIMPCNIMLQFVSGPFAPCNCSGIETRLVICISSAGNNLGSVPWQDCLDAGLAPMPSSRECTPPPNCIQPDPVWQATQWGMCSVTCGIGTQNRLVYCFAGAIVDSSLCSAEDMPPTAQDCDTEVNCPTNYVWLVYTWGQCSVTCGGGFESRDVFCFSLGGNVTQVHDSFCNVGEKLATVRPCNLDACTASWTTSDWSLCSTTCGAGIELRTVTCRVSKDPASNIVEESECIDEDRPSQFRPCFLSICPSAFGCDTTSMLEGTIQYTESSPGFSEGSNYPNDLDCDKGFAASNEIQDAGMVMDNAASTPEYCIQLTFTAFDLESSEDCTFDYLEITDIRYNTSLRLCGNSYDLPLIWMSVGPYISMYFHTDATVNRPGYSVIYSSMQKQEPARYNVSEWSECSVSCGDGVQMREVACYRGNETVDDRDCNNLERPASTQLCQEEECVEQSVCSGDLIRTEDNSILLSPNFPASYPSNVSCFNHLQAPPGMVVQISVTFFNLRPSVECRGDRVSINDVNSEGDSLVLCGSSGPGIIFTSITDEVVVEFASTEDGAIMPNGFGYSLQANFINEQGSPCGREITTSGQAVYSPNYPEDYSDGESCLTIIRNNNGCIQLRFLDIDLPPYTRNGECTDFVQLVDLNIVDVNTGPICSSEIPSVFYSATGLVTVSFFSDNSGEPRGGYNAVARFVECTPALWFTGPFGECSATCGEAFRSRTVICQDPRALDELDPTMCPPEKPDNTIDCDNEECPSCDIQITESGQEIRTPNSPDDYDNNQRCVTEIVNSEGCISITFLEFDLQPGLVEGACDTDFIEITDTRETPIKYCGSTIPEPYQSLSGSVQLVFQSDDAVVSSGLVAYMTFNPCPINAYITGNWSECSVTCGLGMRTREVRCMDLLNNVPADESLCSGERPPSEEPCTADEECPSCDVYVNQTGQFLTSAGFPEGYAANLNCVYTFVSPDPALCVRLTLLEAYLSGPGDEGLCDEDYLEIGSESQQPTVRFCPESARSLTWYSRNNQARMVFITDEEESDSGFNIYNIFGRCLDYDYSVGEYGECSARCDGGLRTRSVACISLDDNSVVDEALCLNQAPVASMPCNEDPCPVCDESFSPGMELIMSPGFSSSPPSYETMLDCAYNITNPDGCLFLTLLNFELQQCDGCSCDSLTVIENGEAALPPLCGSEPVRGWQSQTGNVILEFETDQSISAPGFNIHVAYVPCPDVFFFTGEYSECDVSCGGGGQTRDVYCKIRSTNEQVDESMCTSPKPPTMQPCGEDPCPFCDEDVTSPAFVTSPNHPEEYPVSISCNYNITAPDGECVSVLFLQFELEDVSGASDECNDDFVELTDEAAPAQNRRYCGSTGSSTIEWKSRSRNVNLEFSSNEANTFGGFRAYVDFDSCPFFGFNAGEFGMCSRPCGGGTQTREVSCQYLMTRQQVPDANCEDERPSDSRPCNTDDCPECDTEVTTARQSVFSLNFPQPYFEYKCNYLYSNPGGCVELLFVQFEMPQPNANGVCDKDYLLVEDESSRPFSYRICGDSLPDSVVSRGRSLNVTLITDGNSDTFGEGYQFYNLFMDTCPQAGYVAGEWEECDRQCGGGTRTRSVNCVDLVSGLTIHESLCFDRIPHSMELCNSDPCPTCDELFETFPIWLESPNYPNSFDPQRTCLYNVTSSRCVRINFLNFELPPPNMQNMVCGDSYVQLQDLGAEYLMRRFCGEGQAIDPNVPLYAWESRTGQVMVTLNSGEDIPEGSGFNFYITETDCPEYGFIAGNYSECNTTCGDDGVRTRTVECQRLADGQAAASEDSCTDPKPRDTMVCPPQHPCPSCDVFVDEANMLVMAPMRDATWTADVNCQLTIQLESSCVAIAALELVLSEPDVNGNCVDSSLTFSDGTYPGYTKQVCGSPSPVPVSYRSLTTRFVVDFYSADYLNSDDSYGLYILEADCPTIMYQAGEFSVCSASCGGGVRTRDVTCTRLDLDEEVPAAACMDAPPASEETCNVEECPQECNNVITANNPITVLMSPGQPTYVTESDCSNNIVGLSGCISIELLTIDIEAGSKPGVCDKDYLEISDLSFPELTVQLCGATVPTSNWRSKSGFVRTRFVSDDTDTMQAGYILMYTFEMDCPTGTYILSNWGECSATCSGGIRTAGSLNCELPDMNSGSLSDCPGLPPSTQEECNTNPCPEYYYFTGLLSPCSVTCGDGVQTRVVECRRVDDDAVVDDALCSGVKPESSISCNLMDCASNNLVVNEPSSSTTLFTGDSGTIKSPNYPMNYPNNLNGELVLTIPAGKLLMIVINNLDLVFDTPCTDGDSLRFASGTNELAVCSNASGIPFTWFSMSGETEITVTFTTSAANSATGFSGTWSVIDSV